MVDLAKVRESDLWYIIGYIATDGHLSVDGRHINITSKDREHLYLIRNALFLESKIGSKARSFFKEKLYSHLQFSDVKFYRYLLTLGLTPKKSLTLGPLDIDENHFFDFLRGVIDGDGNISTWIHKSNNNRQWCMRIFSSSLEFILWINSKIEINLGLKGRVYSRNCKMTKKHPNPEYTIKFGKKAAAMIIHNIYYSNCLSLERKRLLAKLCLQSEAKDVKLSSNAQVLEW